MQPASESNKTFAGDGIPSALTTAARLLVAALGALYTVGLLIVNIDLARYGVSNLGLARPEYVMAGAFWALVMIPSGILGVVFHHSLRERLRRREKAHAFLYGFFGVVLGIVIPVLLLATFSVRQEGLFSVSKWELLSRHLIAVLLNRVVVWLVAHFTGDVQQRLQTPEWSLKVSNAGVLSIMTILILTLMLLTYAVLSFPLVAREFGGGHKTMIEVVLSEHAPESWDHFGLPLSADRSRIGPVALLFESQSGLVVTRRVAPGLVWLSEKDLTTVTPSRVESVAIERKSVAGIIYKGRRISE